MPAARIATWGRRVASEVFDRNGPILVTGANTVRGPAFQYRAVNYYDFNLVGKKQPDSLDVGDLFRFTATVEGYENCLLLLSPVETEVR